MIQTIERLVQRYSPGALIWIAIVIISVGAMIPFGIFSVLGSPESSIEFWLWGIWNVATSLFGLVLLYKALIKSFGLDKPKPPSGWRR